ncbi:MAG: hypothetical protein KF770_22335 [Anaerolineae bacterium]|nr:hypothetical protein [Anaerolineae bacterium]
MQPHKILFLVLVMAFGLLAATNNQMVLAAEPASSNKSDETVEIVHPIPQVPIVVDGVKLAPEEITQFNGRELYYLIDGKSELLYIFTTIEGITKQVKQDSVKNNETSSNEVMLSCYQYSAYYQGTYLSGGGPWFVQSGTSGTTFTGVYAFLNNDVESVQTTTCNVYTKLFDNTNFTGSQLWLACCGTTNDLAIYGWGNRAGSIRVD